MERKKQSDEESDKRFDQFIREALDSKFNHLLKSDRVQFESKLNVLSKVSANSIKKVFNESLENEDYKACAFLKQVIEARGEKLS